MGQSRRKFRLVTRSDMDGLVCAVLLRELDMIEDITFVHPKDMQDGKVEITSNDITTNLPYVDRALLAFDHHISETLRIIGDRENFVIDPNAPSAARVVYDSFGGSDRFASIAEEMIEAVDKADSANFTREEVLNPTGWVLLSFLMDSRTGLGRFHGFRISNYQLMMELIEHCRTMPISEILETSDVKERVDLYMQHREMQREQLLRCTRMDGDLAVIELRGEETIYSGNRFMVYVLFPDAAVSMHCMWGKEKYNVVFSVGKSIFKRTCKINIGEVMLGYGGGGHKNAGACQIDTGSAETVKAELIGKFRGDE